MDQLCVSQHAEDTIPQSTVVTVQIGLYQLGSKCVDPPVVVPFAIACGTTVTTATMDDVSEVLENCLNEDNYKYLL